MSTGLPLALLKAVFGSERLDGRAIFLCSRLSFLLLSFLIGLNLSPAYVMPFHRLIVFVLIARLYRIPSESSVRPRRSYLSPTAGIELAAACSPAPTFLQLHRKPVLVFVILYRLLLLSEVAPDVLWCRYCSRLLRTNHVWTSAAVMSSFPKV